VLRYTLPVACLLATAIASAQTTSVAAFSIPKPPTIDGTVDEAEEWKGVPVIEGLVDAETGQSAPVSARYWLAYDKDYVYLAAKLPDDNPASIRAVEYRTNVNLDGDDFVGLDIDLTGSLADFNSFQVNPRGATNASLAGGRAAKREWSGEITAKSRVTATGWETEVRIPWQLMRIPAAGRRNVRFNVGRYVPRLARYFSHVFTGNGQQALTPTWAGVELPKPYVDRSIKLLPFVYGGYDRETGHVANAGLDLKTSLTDQIQLVGTINPDFRNVENQILSLDFSRFARIVGEARPFFQEGVQYYGSGLFASQLVGQFDAGVNVYGRLGQKTSFGFLNTSDFGVGENGTENNFVGTVTHDPNARQSYRIAVTNHSSPGLSNTAYLLRATQLIGKFDVTVRDLGSLDTQAGFGRQSDASISYGDKGMYAYTTYTRSERDFLPRLGFFPEKDFKGWQYGFGGNVNFNKGPINDYGFNFYGTSYDRVDGSPYRRNVGGGLFGTLRNGHYATFSAEFGSFEGQRDTLYSASTGFPRFDRYRNINLGVDWGIQGGSPYRSIGINGAYLLGRRLQLTASRQEVRHFDSTFELSILSANYDLGRDRFLSGRAVRRGRDTNFYMSYRRSGNKGVEYFVILGDPNALTFRTSLIIKAIFPFQIG